MTEKPSNRIRLLGEALVGEKQDRRRFLRKLAASGASLPASYFMLGSGLDGGPIPAARATTVESGARHKSPMRLKVESDPHQFVRDFSDPYIELIRLLREASEIEHALMIQYLYAAFSVKPEYESIIGYGDPNSNDILGVAIQEMQHLAKVNQFLTALGAAPNLVRQDFPYEPDIYPFELSLESLSRKSLAKYAYTEAAASAFDRSRATDASDLAFLDQLDSVLGVDPRPNHIGSVYTTIIRMTEEVLSSGDKALPDLKPWIKVLEDIKAQGEIGHFKLFKRLFMGTHEGFNGRPDVWSLSPADPAYPALQIPINPSAFVGHKNQIEDPVALSIAWLGNLHYWIVLFMLDIGYREDSSDFRDLAKLHMAGPLWSILRHLPRLGAGMPFDPLSMGYGPGRTPAFSLHVTKRMCGEAHRLEQELGDRLPSDFPTSICSETIEVITELSARMRTSDG